MKTRIHRLAIPGLVWTLLALPALSALAMDGGGGGGGGGGGSAAAPSDEQLAQRRFRAAERARERALDYEAEARESDGKGFLGLGKRPSEKAVDAWRDALAGYNEAIRRDPAKYQKAYTDVCLAYRKLGRYEDAIEASEQALQRVPGDPRALECRGQAELARGHLDAATSAYEDLRHGHPALAAQLMQSMKDWLSRVDEQPVDGLSQEKLNAFRRWVAERDELARPDVARPPSA